MRYCLPFLMVSSPILIVSGEALAQPSDEEHWEGAYIGGSFGLAAQNNDRREDVRFDTDLDGNFDNIVRTVGGADAFAPGFCGGAANGAAPAEGCHGDRDGLDYNLRAGYDVHNGKIVYGVLIEGGMNKARDSVSGFSSTPASYTLSRKLDYTLGARARLGYAARGALFYGTGGAAYGKIDNSFTTTNGVNSVTDNGSSNSWGYSYGGGAEVKIARNVSLRLEYLYTNYVDDDYVVSVGAGSAPATNPFILQNASGTDMRRGDSDFDMHSIRLTASLRF